MTSHSCFLKHFLNLVIQSLLESLDFIKYETLFYFRKLILLKAYFVVLML